MRRSLWPLPLLVLVGCGGSSTTTSSVVPGSGPPLLIVREAGTAVRVSADGRWTTTAGRSGALTSATLEALVAGRTSCTSGGTQYTLARSATDTVELDSCTQRLRMKTPVMRAVRAAVQEVGPLQ